MESDPSSTSRTLPVRMLHHEEVDYQNALCNTWGARSRKRERFFVRSSGNNGKGPENIGWNVQFPFLFPLEHRKDKSISAGFQSLILHAG